MPRRAAHFGIGIAIENRLLISAIDKKNRKPIAIAIPNTDSDTDSKRCAGQGA
jgi:hypothetical protein